MKSPIKWFAGTAMLLLLSTTLAWAQAQGQRGPEDLPGDTSAATECGPGEFYIADGEGGGVCLPVAPMIGGKQDPAASACPCVFLEAFHPTHTWFDDPTHPPTCAACDFGPPPEPGCLRLRAGGITADVLGVFQIHGLPSPAADPYTFCEVKRDGVAFQALPPLLTEEELEDCFEDLQTVAIALGVSCPPPPVFAPLPSP